jgi:hypothetical protein
VIGDGIVRCRRCGESLRAETSVVLGFGPTCARRLGIDADAMLSQPADGLIYSQAALRLLAGIPTTWVPMHRYDGSPAWLDTATGELLPRVKELAA